MRGRDGAARVEFAGTSHAVDTTTRSSRRPRMRGAPPANPAFARRRARDTRPDDRRAARG
ncbi:hypothetical protein WT63_28285 [Burkholderia anthina]|nr:hypothetical protein WT63_28285 [Burkholderia anthina]